VRDKSNKGNGLLVTDLKFNERANKTLSHLSLLYITNSSDGEKEREREREREREPNRMY